jgi:ABC-type transport system involved in cytochrome bd biosynthesis fused ATPase/permease subunit
VALAAMLSERVAQRTREKLYGALLGQEPAFFDSVRTGELTSWLGQDVEVLQVTL